MMGGNMPSQIDNNSKYLEEFNHTKMGGNVPSQFSNNSKYLEEFNHIKCIGGGAFGVVFKGEHKLLGVEYAIKRIPVKQEYNLERVLKEARALAKVDHPNIVKFNYAWLEETIPEWQHHIDIRLLAPFSSGILCGTMSSETPESSAAASSMKMIQPKISKQCSESAVYAGKNKYLYIQMEFCGEGNLKDWLFSDERTPSLSKSIFIQILNAVVYLHEQNLIHRDLKPTNIFFSSKDKIKVGDFGLVTTDEANLCHSGCNETLGQHTGYVGTKLYMSPEMVRTDRYNTKVDVYSLGIIFYELLVPFGTEMERCKCLTNIRSNNFPKDFIQKFPKEYEILKKMLIDDPLKRITAMEVKQMVDSMTEDSPGEFKSSSHSLPKFDTILFDGSLCHSEKCLDLTPTGFKTKYSFDLLLVFCKRGICFDFNKENKYTSDNLLVGPKNIPSNATMKELGAVQLVKLSFCHSVFHNPHKIEKNRMVLKNTLLKWKKFPLQRWCRSRNRVWYIVVFVNVNCTSKLSSEWIIKFMPKDKNKLLVKSLKTLPEMSIIIKENARLMSYTWNCELVIRDDPLRMVVRDVLETMNHAIIEIVL